MPKSCVVDSGALVALLDPREEHHAWAREAFLHQPTPWLTCEAVISEIFFLVSGAHALALDKLLRQDQLRIGLSLATELNSILDLRAKYADVPMSLADACLVRMTELLPNPLVLTTDADFKIYRRHSRLVVPCLSP